MVNSAGLDEDSFPRIQHIQSLEMHEMGLALSVFLHINPTPLVSEEFPSSLVLVLTFAVKERWT